MDEPLVKFTMMTGVKRLEPVQYRIEEIAPKPAPWWAFWRKPDRQFVIDSDHAILGPFSREEAQSALDLIRLYSR